MQPIKIKGPIDNIEVFEDKIIITPRGILGYICKGFKGPKEIRFASIRSFQFKEAGLLFDGYLQFSLLEENQKPKNDIFGASYQSGIFRASYDENAFTFSRKQNEEIKKVKHFISERIHPHPTPPTPSTSTDSSHCKKTIGLFFVVGIFLFPILFQRFINNQTNNNPQENQTSSSLTASSENDKGMGISRDKIIRAFGKGQKIFVNFKKAANSNGLENYVGKREDTLFHLIGRKENLNHAYVTTTVYPNTKQNLRGIIYIIGFGHQFSESSTKWIGNHLKEFFKKKTEAKISKEIDGKMFTLTLTKNTGTHDKLTLSIAAI